MTFALGPFTLKFDTLIATNADARPLWSRHEPHALAWWATAWMEPSERITLAYRRHAPFVFRRARQILGTEADAEEVVQDVFMSLYERPDQFRGKSSLATFLYSATTHACLNRVRNQNNRLRLQRESIEPSASEADQRLSPEQLLMLQRAVAKMPRELAEAAVYYVIDGLTHAEIARLLDCSRRHVGHLLERVEAWGKQSANTEEQP